eukprot:TRINITY_DN177_c0_g1_i1.p1 TRINITY_DN177_c0_g1~~TRINITY_DN177_c0_g1_i1.p1  ORF type:complete len:427 (-),score=133.25 TRINITY_DN177_c0_g1_i1:391-1548(-)
MTEKVYSFQTIDKALMVKINTFPDGMDRDLRKQFDWCSLIRFSVLNPEDPDKEVIQRKIFEEGFDDIKMDRAVGSVLGMPLGDSLGAPMEFSAIRYGSDELQDMGQEDIWKGKRYNHFGLRPGQWTDDASMGLCIADSLLVNRGFNPLDLRLRFYNWVHLGYNNAFGYDKKPRHSIGLGGNISMSISEFTRRQIPFTEAGDIKTSGNGSVMRLSPAPVYFWNNIEDAMLYSYQQSKTTHQGDEAAECCRLLAWVIVTAINWEGTPTATRPATRSASEATSACPSASSLVVRSPSLRLVTSRPLETALSCVSPPRPFTSGTTSKTPCSIRTNRARPPTKVMRLLSAAVSLPGSSSLRSTGRALPLPSKFSMPSLLRTRPSSRPSTL